MTAMNWENAPTKIISFDGGGIRGIIPLSILKNIDFSQNLLSNPTILAGTSTGAIIAAGLSIGKSVDELHSLYQNASNQIFGKKRSVLSMIRGFPMYSSGPLRQLLRNEFGTKRLGDCRCMTIIPAISASLMSPRIFNSSEDKDVMLADAVEASASAPFFFESFEIDKERFVDGGLSFNNPSLVALQEAMSRGAKTNTIKLLSFGTGHEQKLASQQEIDHVWPWERGLNTIELCMRSTSDHAHQSCLGHFKREPERYCRLDPELPYRIKLDDIKAVPSLQVIGKNAARDHRDELAALRNLDRA